jgi:hypothetical protein
MDNKYWIGRKRSAMGMARDAATAEARLIHYDLAGRYSIKAAQCLPFATAESRRTAGGERPVLHLRRPESPPSAPLHLPSGGEGS